MQRRELPDVTTGAPAIELEGITRQFGSFTAVANLDLTVRRGEFFSLLGPSGCGKTTVLRLIAGLDLPDAGSIRIGGREMSGVPAHHRPVNTVFQSYALFPHMTVNENIEFGLQMKNVARADRRKRSRQIMELVEIGDLGDRKPAQLSGGQKQRVALARALVNEPEVLLLDEPLGALDLKLRKTLQAELRRIQQRLGMTFIYVTHDQEEALAMSDRIAVMQSGRIEQVGTGRAVYDQPRTRFVAQFLGACNIIEGTVQSATEAQVTLATAFGPIAADRPGNQRLPEPGGSCAIAIRPEKIRLFSGTSNLSAEPGVNWFLGCIAGAAFNGSWVQYELHTAGGALKVSILNAGAGDELLRAGTNVQVQLPRDAFVFLEG